MSPASDARPEATFFDSPAAFRAWLEEHHASASELWVGFQRAGKTKPPVTWAEAVDEALCYGWIDGIRKRIDGDRYANRFTPRKPGSTWSGVNVANVQRLSAAGRMHASGMRAFEARTAGRTGTYSYEASGDELDPGYAERLAASPDAQRFWEAQAPWYRRTATHWVTSAKRQETRDRRFAALLEDCAAGRRIALVRAGERRQP